MKLKLFLFGVIGFVAVTLVLITGKIVPLLMVLQSFFFFVMQFVLGLLGIWAIGQGGLFLWMKFEKKRRARRQQLKLKTRIYARPEFNPIQPEVVPEVSVESTPEVNPEANQSNPSAGGNVAA
ncbi:MAG: hypothetical protein HYZ83_02240 [Candidatus Omnitrophica bacterium]|nr:hypothetical protein [Candidatus Omnitrophota bacterium]